MSTLTDELARLRLGVDTKVRVYAPGVDSALPSDPHTDVSAWVEAWTLNRARDFGAAELTLRLPLTEETILDAPNVFKRMAPVVVESLVLYEDGSWHSIQHGVFYVDEVRMTETRIPDTIEVRALDGLVFTLLGYYTGKHEPDRIYMGQRELTTADRQTWYDPLLYKNWCSDAAAQVYVKSTAEGAYSNIAWPRSPEDEDFGHSFVFGDGLVVFDAVLPDTVTGVYCVYWRYKTGSEY